MKKNVLIIGAGKIGSTIARLLPEENYSITVSDMSNEALNNPVFKKYKTLVLNVLNEKELSSILTDQDYVVNAGPYFLAEHIARAANESKTHYFDLTEDVEQTNIIRSIAKKSKSKTVFVPQCGLAPGFIGIAANSLAKKFDTVESIKMRVGALPRNPNNRLRYNMTWSTEGLVNEYLHPCNAVIYGKFEQVSPLEGYETFNLDGNEYEAFNTSGGLGTLCETWDGKVQEMNYKSIRYPGHREYIKFLIDDMKFGEDNGKSLMELLNQTTPQTRDDVVIIFIVVVGKLNGRYHQEIWSKKVYSNSELTAIELTTASSLCAMIELHRAGKTSKKGFVKQEDIDFKDLMDALSSLSVGNVYA